MTKVELQQKIIEYFLACGPTDGKVTVEFQDSTCRIHLVKMYQGLNNWISFSRLNWLSQLLNTEDINLEDESYSSGCGSCDYGSRTEATIVCYKISMPQ